ncbi:hypothetical protein ACN38_g12957, partial [Penicillium nordicum]
FYCGDTIINNT